MSKNVQPQIKKLALARETLVDLRVKTSVKAGGSFVTNGGECATQGGDSANGCGGGHVKVR